MAMLMGTMLINHAMFAVFSAQQKSAFLVLFSKAM
jgi:hypothetical protein